MLDAGSAIELRDVGVCYRVQRERILSLKETMVRSLSRWGGHLAGRKPEVLSHEFWAIRGVSLKVKKGSTVGLKGRNGSGKSTTLKVISGVLFPTEGELWVRGRISALVELGAGFDMELTGRENIFLGSSVAGLSRKETEKRIAHIVEFSELGDFIDIPVRNYSSGMYARLGFALATDVDPDVLIIDEILAVGDAAFQEKCMQRMLDFKRRGKTILYVSHDPGLVESFCDEIVTLEDGRIVDAPKRTSGLGNAWGDR